MANSQDLIPSKRVIISINGRSTDSISLDLAIRFTDSNKLVGQIISGRLSPLPPQLSSAYLAWKNSYLKWGKTYRHWQIPSRSIVVPSNPIETNISIQNCDILEEKLIQEFNAWLSTSPGLAQIRENLLANVAPDRYYHRPDLLFFVVQTRTNDPLLDLDLQRLPWNEWKFIRDYYRTSIALSTNNAPIMEPQITKFKALVICGKYEDPNNHIDLQPDLDALKKHLGNTVELETWISDSKVKSKLELLEKLDKSTYQLLFFCGHSSSNNQIQLNDDEYISIDDNRFQQVLNNLRSRGLVLAFFNSCDGLGIARSLMSVGIPYVVVMKELVHDRVAHEFIKGFLERAIQPEIPVHVAVDRARQELEWLKELPHGEFLPVLFQNPEQPPLYINPAQSESTSSRTVKAQILAKNPLVLALLTVIVVLTINFLSHSIWPISDGLEGRISMGERHLKGSHDLDLDLAYSYFNSRKYDLSLKEFDRYLNTEFNYEEKAYKQISANPEIVIFRNNAKAYSQSSKTGTKVLKIATSVPLKNHPIAIEILHGIAQYQTKHNRNVDSTQPKLAIAIGSDDNNPDLAAKIATKFVADPDILAVIGHNASDASEAAAPIYNQHQLVMISPTSFSDSLKKKSPTDSLYRMVPQMNIFATQLADHIEKIAKNSKLKVGICVDPDSPDNNSFQKQFNNNLRSKAFKALDLECGSFDNINQPQKRQKIIDKLSVNQIDTMLVAPHINKLDRTVTFLKAVRQDPRLKNLKQIGSPSLYTKYVSDRNEDKLLDGLILIVPYYPDPRKSNSFITSFQAEWKIPLETWRTPMSYAAMAVIAHNLSSSSTRETLNQSMSKIDRIYETDMALAKFYFNAEGERSTDDPKDTIGPLIQLVGKQFVTAPPVN
jgi:branched-chain amino acid transport system substrate-binding protein